SLDNILSLTNRFEDILRGITNSDESNGVEADVSNLETTITASPTPTLRIHKNHPKSQIIGPVDTPIQTRNKSKEVGEQSFIATIHQKTDPALLQFCLFSCFLSQVEPKKISDALQHLSWVEAMQEELLQFKIQKVWTLVDCPKEVRPIGTKWVLKNKKDERGIVIRNKARLVAQGHTQEEGINYDEVFAPVVRIEAIRLFLAYALFMGFTVYQMDMKSAFFYGTIDEEVGTIDQTLFIRRQRGDFILVQVYVDDIIFRSSNPQLYREFKALMHEKFQMSAMGELNFFLGLYSDVRSSNTPMDKENPWGKDGTGKDVDLHLYRSMIGSLMYLTASRPDIMFAVYACARHQVTPKECHFHAVKRIFRYLKGHPKLRLWYPKDSPFDLVAYSDSDYGGATQDRKSTTRGLSMTCETLSREISTSILRFNTVMARLQFCDYHNMVAILEKGEHNIDFHLMVDFVEASPLRIETTEEGTKILATVDGILRTVTESSLRRNLKLQDEEGINSLPDTKLFKNLSLMGYNISQNQKFTFQKGQFSHQWKYLIHTIMQCLSPKSTGFNEFSSNIATALICLATNRTYNFSKMIFDGLVKNINNKEHQLSPITHPPQRHNHHLTVTPSKTTTLRQYTRRARIAQSSTLPPVADEPASPVRDASQGE
nr:hypothetical protein [Tanacetum cinerariifolium]